MRHAIVITSIVLGGIAVADLVWGNSTNAVLPDALGNHLNQQTDIALLGAAAIGTWYAFSHVRA